MKDNAQLKHIYCEVVFPIPLRQSFTYSVNLNCVNLYDVYDLIGRRVLVDFGKQKDKIGVIVDARIVKKKLKPSNIQIKPIKSILDPSPLFDKEQIKSATELSKLYFVSLGEFLNHFFPIEHNYNITQSLVSYEKKQNYILELNKEYISSFEKKKKVLFIPKDIEEKFDFYKNLIFYSFKENLQTIMLFSSNYYLEDFYNYLTSSQNSEEDLKILNKNLIIYSGEKSLNERYKIWYFVKHKLVNVILSTKIGVFLPFENVSYILVDEPDFNGFINNSVPMYSVYDIVNHRAKEKKIIYCSFAPSIKLMYENKKFIFQDKKDFENKNIETLFVKKKVIDIIKKDFYKFKKTIVFFPYKGYTRYYVCDCCGEVFYNYQIKKQKMNFFCPKCKSSKFVGYGMGIEKFVEIIRSNLPKEINIAYLDSEVKENKKTEIVNNFNNNKIDVVVATYEILNYIYKLNFSNIGSIYFAYLDGILNRISYLSYESFYTLLCLFKVLIKNQTKIYLEIFSQHEDIKKFLYSYEKFYRTELSLRKELLYPPYCKILSIDLIYEKIYIKIIEDIRISLQKIVDIKYYEMSLHQEAEERKLKTSLFIKVPNNKKFLISKIVEILEKNLEYNAEILVYIQFNPKN